MQKKILTLLALLLPLIVGEVQAQKSLPSKHGFEQNRKSANARETFGQNRKSANARGVQSATTAQTPSRRSVLRLPSTPALAPTYVAVSDITPTSATVSWNGTGDSYNLRYRKMYLSEDFESCSQNQLPAGWTALDADGDGHSWFTWDYTDFPTDKNDNPQSFDKKSVLSASYNEVTQTALTPNNWLISPQVPLKGKLSLWAKGVDPDYAAEHFAVCLSTTGKDVADFTTVLIPETAAQDVFTEYTADLSAYAGQVGYIAIRHFNISDMFQLAVDNITITDNWVEVDGVTSPYTLDGLDDLSIYEVEVQAVTGEQQSSWSTLRFNTTAATYSVTLKEGTEDADNWTITPEEAKTTGVLEGTEITATYSGTKMVKSVKAVKKAAPAPATGHPLSASEVGEIVGSDGLAYAAADKDNLPSGVTAAAMVAYKSETAGSSLALALTDEDNMTWDNSATSNKGKTAPELCSALNTSKAVTGGTWKLPSKDEWKQMFSANGGNEGSYTGLNTALGNAGGTALLENEDYWSSSEDNDNEGYAWLVNLAGGNASWDTYGTHYTRCVRACLAF